MLTANDLKVMNECTTIRMIVMSILQYHNLETSQYVGCVFNSDTELQKNDIISEFESIFDKCNDFFKQYGYTVTMVEEIKKSSTDYFIKVKAN